MVKPLFSHFLTHFNQVLSMPTFYMLEIVLSNTPCIKMYSLLLAINYSYTTDFTSVVMILMLLTIG